jgi:hypothetical protein
MNYAELEKKVKTMSAHDIIMAMVEGLRSPRTRIDMHSFGYIMRGGVCYGCAATNAILHIMEAKEYEVADHIRDRVPIDYLAFIMCKVDSFLNTFELAIDLLRCGCVAQYNQYAADFGIAQITPMPGQKLPWLYNDYTEDQLQEYEKLAKYQLTV